MNIVVLGGGTAGYIAALSLNKKVSGARVVVVDSSKYGPIGVGEGTTLNFSRLLKELDIDIDDVLIHAGGTVKTGIKFTNWGTKQSHYWHSFSNPTMEQRSLQNFIKSKSLLKDQSLNYSEFSLSKLKDFSSVIASAIDKDGNLNKISHFGSIAEEDKFDTSSYAVHFDAGKVLSFLRGIALSRGVEVVDDEFANVEQDSFGNIKSVKLLSRVLDCDFVIDATGTNRLLVGEHFNSDWVDLSNSLPCNSALAFWLPIDDPTVYTESIAMDFGWCWKIPLQERFGCGYVYDSSMITKEEAIREIKNRFGENVDIRKHIEFKSGYFKTPLRNNCLAVGLSSGFFEPLEATSISISIELLNALTSDYFSELFHNNSEKKEKEFNDLFCMLNEEVFCFIYLHYITNKTNTDFWSNFVKNNVMPNKISAFLNNMNNDLFSSEFIQNQSNVFDWFSWVTVYAGNELYNSDTIMRLLDSKSELVYNNIVKEIDSKKPQSINFNTYIDNIIKKGETYERN